MNTIYWYDYETFGIDPRHDRIAQFAGLRTDEDLNVIGDLLVLYCQPADDVLPAMQAIRFQLQRDSDNWPGNSEASIATGADPRRGDMI